MNAALFRNWTTTEKEKNILVSGGSLFFFSMFALQTCRATNVFLLELKDWICSFFNKLSLLLPSLQLAAQCTLWFLMRKQLARPISAAWQKFQCYFKCQSGFDSFVANNLDLLLVTEEISAFRHFRRERRHKRKWLISSRNIMFWTFFFFLNAWTKKLH